MEILRIENVNKSYKNKQVLKDINMNVNQGEIVGLIGKNGSGKSTLMKAICQLINIDSGTIKVLDLDVTKNREDILKVMSVIIERPSLYPNLTVKQQIEANGDLRNLSKDDVLEAFEYIDFGKDIKLKNRKLSLGMKQEVALAMAFMNKSKLYLLDEPINGLDFDNVIKFRNRIIKEKEAGAAILISSHILKELEVVADRFVFIHKGKIIGEVKNDHDDIEALYREMINNEETNQI